MFTRLPSCKITGAILVALVLFTFALANAPKAEADEGNTHTTVVAMHGDTATVVTQRGVVVASTLRHCPLEDGGPRLRKHGPCTWNIGTEADGNGQGLAYVLYLDHGQRRATYVWTTSPAVNGWHWMRGSGCVVKGGVEHIRCADGRHLGVSDRRPVSPIRQPQIEDPPLPCDPACSRTRS